MTTAASDLELPDTEHTICELGHKHGRIIMNLHSERLDPRFLVWTPEEGRQIAWKLLALADAVDPPPVDAASALPTAHRVVEGERVQGIVFGDLPLELQRLILTIYDLTKHDVERNFTPTEVARRMHALGLHEADGADVQQTRFWLLRKLGPRR